MIDHDQNEAASSSNITACTMGVARQNIAMTEKSTVSARAAPSDVASAACAAANAARVATPTRTAPAAARTR